MDMKAGPPKPWISVDQSRGSPDADVALKKRRMNLPAVPAVSSDEQAGAVCVCVCGGGGGACAPMQGTAAGGHGMQEAAAAAP